MTARSLIAMLVLASVVFNVKLRAGEPFRIQLIDDSNGWPVPLVELRTTHNVRFVSDNNGVVAFDLPELMNVQTWLHVEGHGYTVKKDGFGYHGVKVVPRSGEQITIKLKRELPAKRLGRITGGGLFSESQKLGEETQWKEQRILGCDSVQNFVHNQKLHWGWGDTVLAIAWNDFRTKWVTIFTQHYGDRSELGEIWYAESESPMGPWKDAIKIVTHNNYTFYNPQLHPGFTPKGSPVLLFEATFTHTFSKTESPTPRSDYNQVLYRIDLDELPASISESR